MLRASFIHRPPEWKPQQLNLDVIANNMSNVNTTGYKKSKIEFQDLLYDTTRAPGADQGNNSLLPTGYARSVTALKLPPLQKFLPKAN